MKPKVAVVNLFPEIEKIREFAEKYRFQGIDWSFDLETLPGTPQKESRWVQDQAALSPFEVRYHCPFYQIDLGHDDPVHAGSASELFSRIIRLVARAGGKYLSIHIGLGRDSTKPLSWETSVQNLKNLVQFAAGFNVRVCLENLAWGWTSRPNLFEKLIRRTGAGVTLDLGHAYICESVQSQQYMVEDFVSPHADVVFNAHVYHSEISGRGHVPPGNLGVIENRFAILRKIGCPWWAIELKEPEEILTTKMLIDDFLTMGQN